MTPACVAFGARHASPCPSPNPHPRRRSATQVYLRRDARDGLARHPGLLPLRSSRCSKCRSLTGGTSVIRSRAAVCLQGLRISRRRCPARLRAGRSAACNQGVPKHEMTKGWGRSFEDPIDVDGRKLLTERSSGHAGREGGQPWRRSNSLKTNHSAPAAQSRQTSKNRTKLKRSRHVDQIARSLSTCLRM